MDRDWAETVRSPFRTIEGSRQNVTINMKTLFKLHVLFKTNFIVCQNKRNESNQVWASNPHPITENFVKICRSVASRLDDDRVKENLRERETDGQTDQWGGGGGWSIKRKVSNFVVVWEGIRCPHSTPLPTATGPQRDNDKPLLTNKKTKYLRTKTCYLCDMIGRHLS